MMQPKQITHAEPGSWIMPEYASVCAFSADNKFLVLLHSGGYCGLYSGDGELIRMIPVGHNQEPRWDSVANALYFIRGNAIYRYNADADDIDLFHVFDEYVDFDDVERNGVSGLGEGDIESNRIALTGMRTTGQRDVFLFDLAKLRKGKMLTLDAYRINGLDNVYATPSGNVQIGWKAQGEGRFQGVELFDGDLDFLRQLAPVIGHNDTTRGATIWCSAADASINKNAVVLIDHATGDKFVLMDLDWRYAFHVSSGADFSIVSTYAPSNELPSQVWKVPHDGATPELVCETGSIMPRADMYNAQPKASVSRDGSRLVFSSNSGIMDRGPHYCNTFMVKLEGAKPEPKPIEVDETRIDYSPFVGQEFIMRPRADGAVDMFQRRKK
jgi:hypothetical protein